MRVHLKILFAAIICISTIPSYAQRLEQQHFVFMINGIAGRDDTFGFFQDAVTNHKLAAGSDEHYEYFDFKYESGNDKKDIFHFAIDFCDYIEYQLIYHKRLRPQDRISIVAHSQGGLVTTYLLLMMFSDQDLACSKLKNNMDAFISLSTPFWGAKSAHMMSEVNRFLGSLGIDTPYGNNELKQMSFGSENITAFRKHFSLRKSEDIIEDIKNNIRILSIVGFAKFFKAIENFATGRFEFEDDLVVPIPSQSLNHIKLVSYLKDYEDGHFLDDLSLFQDVDLGETRLVKACHTPLLVHNDNETFLTRMLGFKGLSRKLQGVAYIPSECLDPSTCYHQSLPLMVNHLLGKEVPKYFELEKKLTGFLIDVRVKVPESFLDRPRKVDIKFEQESINVLKPWKRRKVVIPHFAEIMSEGYQTLDDSHRYYYTGSVIDTWNQEIQDYDPHHVVMTVFGKGLKTRKIKVKIKAGHSTYVDLNLLPKN